MKPQPELPEPVLLDAVEAILPKPLDEMPHDEIVQYVDEHFEALQEELRMRDFHPEVYVPPLRAEDDTDRTIRDKALESLASTGALWKPPSDSSRE